MAPGNQFLLSSTAFSPALFLSQAYSSASTQALLQGLDFLSRSIDQKTAALKALVESNFERFVRAKATIDHVYYEMRTQGGESLGEPQRALSRHASRSSNHFRNASGAGSGVHSGLRGSKQVPGDRTKNALVRELEYGVQGIKTPMLELSVKANELWGPAMGGIQREEQLRSVLNAIGQYRAIFEAPATIAACIRRKDYQALTDEYTSARRYVADAKHVADVGMESTVPLTDLQIHQIIVTSQMWLDVEAQIEDFKREIWRRLVSTRIGTPSSSGNAIDEQTEDHMKLIGVLLELGVQDNPIWVWLLSQYDYLKRKITAVTRRFRFETEFLRRRLGGGEKANMQDTASRLRLALQQASQSDPGDLDVSKVMEFWDGVYTSLQVILSSPGGILGDVAIFWETAQSFIEGKTQRILPVGVDGRSRKHHRLSVDGVKDLQNGILELVSLIQDTIVSLFVEPPPDDLPALSSQAATASRTTPALVLPRSAFKGARFSLQGNNNNNNMPPASVGNGQFWEKFAFWPPYSNSLSGVYHLAKILVLIGTAASEMAILGPVTQTTNMKERLRGLVGAVRERCVQAICASWNDDSEYCRGLEDWTRPSEQKDITNMPSYFATFETDILSGLQKVLYLEEAVMTARSAQVISPPRAKILQLVRSQFVTSLYKSLSGMVENAERPMEVEDDDEWVVGGKSGLWIRRPAQTLSATVVAADGGDRNVRMLLTLGNLQALRRDVVPQLVTQFENSFSVKLTEESKTIRDVLGQIDARLFHSYIRPLVAQLSRIIRAGVLSPSWPPPTGGRPSEVRPYVYEVLVALVLVHTQVSSTASTLTGQILSYLLEQMSREFLDVFQKRQRFSLAALMQATLDVEFVAQTLGQYTTEKASELQAQIYLELGKSTESDADRRLQTELPEMRNVLRTLRDQSRAQFACFKKPRSAPRQPPPPL